MKVVRFGNIQLRHVREPEIILLVESASCVLESALQLKESGIPPTIGIRNPSSTYQESGIHGVESRVQDCLGFPYVG